LISCWPLPPDVGTQSTLRPDVPHHRQCFSPSRSCPAGHRLADPAGPLAGTIFSLAAGSAATFGILSFAFDPGIYAAHLSLALPTAVNLAVFSLGLVCARTEWGLGALLCSQSLGGSLARRLLPAAFVPVVVGWIRWQITATGHYSEWSIVALAALITSSLLAGLIAWAAVAVDRSDAERKK
jgi:hypothetical protein